MKRQVIFGVVAILSIVIVVFGVSQDFRKKRELAEAAARTRAYAVDETMLQKWSTVLPDTAKSYNELKDSFDNGNRVKTASEIQTASNYILNKPESTRQAYEDLVWAVLNSKEFLFNH